MSYKLTRLVSPKNEVIELCEIKMKELNNYYDSTFLNFRNLTKTPIKLRKLRKQLSMRNYVEIEHSFIYFLVLGEQPKAILKCQNLELNDEQR